MIDHQTYNHLQNVIRREGRSFLQYAGESFPWSTPQQRDTVEQVQVLVREQRDAAAALSRHLVKHRLTPPYLGAYPSYFTSYNFMSLDRLLPLLVEHQKRGISALETDLSALKDEETHKEVEAILHTKRRHLQVLQGLASL